MMAGAGDEPQEDQFVWGVLAPDSPIRPSDANSAPM